MYQFSLYQNILSLIVGIFILFWGLSSIKNKTETSKDRYNVIFEKKTGWWAVVIGTGVLIIGLLFILVSLIGFFGEKN